MMQVVIFLKYHECMDRSHKVIEVLIFYLSHLSFSLLSFLKLTTLKLISSLFKQFEKFSVWKNELDGWLDNSTVIIFAFCSYFSFNCVSKGTNIALLVITFSVRVATRRFVGVVSLIF